LPIRTSLMQTQQASLNIEFVQPTPGEVCRFASIFGWPESLLHSLMLPSFNAVPFYFLVSMSEGTLKANYFEKGLANLPIPFELWKQSPLAPTYVVDLGNSACTCTHSVLTKFPCKHIFAVLRCTGTRLADLSVCRTNPWFNIDYSVSSWLYFHQLLLTNAIQCYNRGAYLCNTCSD